MATSNFHNVNASKIFAIEIVEEFEYQDLIDNLTYELEAKGFHIGSGRDSNELRSFPSKVIGSKTISKSFNGVEVEVEISAIVRSGYYSGVNLDWEINYCNGRNFEGELPDTDYIAEDLEYYGNMNRGMALIQAKNVHKFFEKTKNILSTELETIFENYSTPLIVVARFSNGETMYETSK
jgi:hypothetical protein